MALLTGMLPGCGKHTRATWDAPRDWKQFRDTTTGVEIAYPPDLQVVPDAFDAVTLREASKWRPIVVFRNAEFDRDEHLVKPGAVLLGVFRRVLTEADRRGPREVILCKNLAGGWSEDMGDYVRPNANPIAGWQVPRSPPELSDCIPFEFNAHGVTMVDVAMMSGRVTSRSPESGSRPGEVRVVIRVGTDASRAYAVLANKWSGGGKRQDELLRTVAEGIIASVRE